MSSPVAVETMAALLDLKAVERTLTGLRCTPTRVPGEMRLTSLWVKPGRYFNAVYDWFESSADPSSGPTPGTAMSLFALGAPAANRAKRRMGRHDHAAAERPFPTCARCASAVTPGGVLVQRFPFDYRLHTLPRCQDRHVVSLFMGARVEGVVATTYRAGMRCQIEYTLEDGRRLFGKVAFEREPGTSFGKQRGIYDALRSGPGELRVARPDRYVENLNLSVVEAVDGESLDRGYPGDAALAVLPRVARALARFHSLDPVVTERVHAVREEVELLGPWVVLVSALFPELAEDLGARFGDLERTAPGAPDVLRLVHRDFFDKQVIVAEGYIALIDLDTACGGEPEIDLANFCVHLRLRARQGSGEVDAAAQVETFLRAYPGRFKQARFDWYRRAASLRLACVYALREAWRPLVPGLIADARPASGAVDPREV